MAFTLRNLAVLAYAQGFTLWVYRATMPISAVGEHFFSPGADMFRTGDHIHVSAIDGAALLWVESSDDTAAVVTRRMVAP